MKWTRLLQCINLHLTDECSAPRGTFAPGQGSAGLRMSWLALRSFTKGGIGLKRTTRVFQSRQQIKPYWGTMASLGGLEELPRLVTTPACKRPRSPETGETKDKKRIKGSEKEGEKSSRLLVCFDLEMSDGSFASEIFQVIWTTLALTNIS